MKIKEINRINFSQSFLSKKRLSIHVSIKGFFFKWPPHLYLHKAISLFFAGNVIKRKHYFKLIINDFSISPYIL